MTLPASGQLGLGDINVELGRSRTSQISLDTAENGGYGAINVNSRSRPNGANPAAVSEWYSYNHNARPPVTTQRIRWSHFRGGPTGGTMRILRNGSQIVLTTTSPTNQIGFFDANAGDNINVRVLESPKADDYTEIYVESQVNGYIIDDFRYNGNAEVNFIVQTADGEYLITSQQNPFL